MPIVNIQGVGLVNFPDEMSREQINSAIEKKILPKFPEVQAQVPRGFVSGAKDIGASFVSGVGNLMQLPGQISELVGFTRTGDLPEQQKTGIQALGADIQKFGEEAKSPTLIAKEQLRAREIDKAEGPIQEGVAALKTTVTDPALLTSFFAEQIPNLIGTYGFGILGKGGAKLLLKQATEDAMNATAAKVGVGSAVAGGAVMQGTDVGYDTYQTIYKQLKEQGVPDDEAQGIALAKGRVAAIEAAGLSIASARLPGGTAIERALVGKGMPGTAGFLKSTVGEIGSEAIEEGGGAFAKQVGIKEVFPETDLLKGVGAATALGGLGGALFGAPAGVVNALRARQETPPPLEQPPVEFPAPTGFIPPEEPPAAPPIAPPVETLPPVTPPVVPPVAVQPPKEPPKDALQNYFTGLPEGSEIVFQNRDRSTQASILQMQSIAANPDYSRISESKEFGTGAPVTISTFDLPSKFLGNTDTATLPDGTKVPVMYAVVPAAMVHSSNLADGTLDPMYTDMQQDGLRAIAGNGRIAGLKAAYTRGTAEDYKNQLIADKNHGVNPDFIKEMPNPVLVRIMPQSYVTPNIADLSNRPTVARLSPVETAKNDIRRIDLGGLEFNEDGTPSGKTLMQFINAMPIEERTELTDKSGRPTTQAIDRLANAIFQKAYGSDSLIDLYAQAADPEAKTILNALARVAPKMAQLEGAGEYDVRNAIIQAAELAVNARRTGMNLKTAAQQIGLDVDPNSALVLDMFADNVRSGKRIGERLGALADEALKQTQAGTDMFGEVPKRPLSEIYGVLKAPMEEPGLFGETTEEPPKPTERKEFTIDKTPLEIQNELKGKSISYLAKWLVDNAPNSFAKEIAQKIKNRVDEYVRIGVPLEFKVFTGSARRKSYMGVLKPKNLGGGKIGYEINLNGPGPNGVPDGITGTDYETALHEMLHLSTSMQIKSSLQSPEGKELTELLKFIRKKVTEDYNNNVDHPLLNTLKSRIKAKNWNAGINILKNERELLAWGLSNSEFQDYLSKLKYSDNKSAYDKFVELVRKLLNIDKEYETAMERLVSVSGKLMDVPIDELAKQIKVRGWTLGKEATQIEKREIDLSKLPPGRSRELAQAAAKVADGTMTREQFEEMVNKYAPIAPVPAPRPPASNEAMRNALATNQKDKLNPEIADGTPVGLRMDINALRKGASVVSIHQGSNTSKVGQVIGYGSVAAATDVKFSNRNQQALLKVATGEGKLPAQTMEGKYKNISPEEAFNRVKELMNDPEWIQVGVDPTRHGYFYDRSNAMPVKSADELIQIGNFVLAKNAVYDEKENYLYRQLEGKEIESDERTLGEAAVGKAQQMLQKRKIPADAFADVDPGLMKLAQPLFFPQNKTIIDRIAGLRDNFWKKAAQGIADQYRAIKDYSEEGYMQARMSKTVDGALEGLTFFGQVFNNKGALDIKQGTKGLMEIMKPIGKEVDRYQMWVALNREANLPMEKRTKMPGIGELIKRRAEFAEGTIDGKPRLEVYNKVRTDMNGLNRSVLKVALDAGLIDSSQQKIDELRSRDFLTSKDREILTRDLRAEIERIENKKAMNITEADKDLLRDYRAMIRDINSMDVMTDQIRNDLINYYTQNPGAYERFSADINYIPFYRAMEDGDLQGASTASGLTNQAFSRELKGGERPYGDLMENTLRNWSHILSASMKNQAVNTTMKAAVEFGAAAPNLKLQYEFIDGKVVNRSTGEIIGDGEVKPYMTTADKGTVKMMVEGQPIYYRVLDPMLMDSISSIGYMGPKSKFLDVARDFKNMLQFGVTISPAFKVRNLFRDSISAIAVTDLKKNPFANVVEGWIASNRNNPAHISALAGGAIFNFGTAYEGDQSKLIKRLLDQGVDANTILDSPEKVKKGLTILWEKYKDWGNKSEAANRMALYNQLKAKGYDHLQASFYARDLLDFSMQGSWPAFRLAAQTIPFLNARVQGLYKLGRDGITPTGRFLYNTITGKEIEANDAQKARSFGYTTLAVAMASMLLYLAFKDDEEYQKREAWDRDNFWWFRLPGMDAAVRVPKPFEIGAFGTMAERVLEQIVDQGAEGKAFGDSMFRMLTDTFAINPIPQVIRPLVDIYANKDAFTGAPIESAGMERLSKQERATDATSPIAQALGGLSSIFGEKLSFSPVQVDYAIKAYFGWLGGTATQASVYATLPFRDGAYPDIKVMDKVSQGFIKSLPSDQSRYVTSFYENNKEINQAYADMRHYAELGETDKVQKILEEKGDKIALNKMYDKTAKEMANVRAQIRVITNDKTMDGTTKREMIDNMKQILSMLAEQAETTRKYLKANK